MTLLNPDPTTLQLHSPALGPWFDDDDVTLPLPAAGLLDVTLTLQDVSWLPPASGLLSFFIATSPRPAGLAGLRGPTARPPSTTAASSPSSACCRRVERRSTHSPCRSRRRRTRRRRTFPRDPSCGRSRWSCRRRRATSNASVALLPDAFDFASGVTSDEERAAYLGLTWRRTTLRQRTSADDRPPAARPAFFQGSNTAQELLQFPNSTSVQMWAFDHRGRPLDPGAVAAWWNLQAGTAHTNLWADGVAQRTVQVANGLTFHLVNAHEGPLDAADRQVAAHERHRERRRAAGQQQQRRHGGVHRRAERRRLPAAARCGPTRRSLHQPGPGVAERRIGQSGAGLRADRRAVGRARPRWAEAHRGIGSR